MVKLSLQVLTAVVLVAVAIREVIQLVRHREDPTLRVLAPGLVCLALAASLGIPKLTLPIMVHLLGGFFGDLIDVLWLTMAYCFAAFFLLADESSPSSASRRSALREFVGLVLALAAMHAFYAAGYASGAFHNRLADFRSWYVAGFDLSGGGYALIISAIGIRRAVRYRRTVEHVWLRRSLWLVTVGALGMTFGVNGCSIIIDALHAILGPSGPAKFPVLDTLYVVGQLGGQTALAAGLVLPAVAEAVSRVGTVRDRVLQMRYRRQMTFLWSALTDEFPYIVLPRLDSPTGLTSVRSRDFTRATSEIADGLAQLAPYYPAAGLVFVQDANTGVTDPRAAAKIVGAALSAHAAGAERAAAPYARIEPDFRGWRGRGRWMATLSQALQQRGTSSYRARSATSS